MGGTRSGTNGRLTHHQQRPEAAEEKWGIDVNGGEAVKWGIDGNGGEAVKWGIDVNGGEAVKWGQDEVD